MIWACLCKAPYVVFHPHRNIFLEVIGTHSAVANQIPNVSLFLLACAFQDAGGEALPLSVMLSCLSNVSAPALRANAQLFFQLWQEFFRESCFQSTFLPVVLDLAYGNVKGSCLIQSPYICFPKLPEDLPGTAPVPSPPQERTIIIPNSWYFDKTMLLN